MTPKTVSDIISNPQNTNSQPNVQSEANTYLPTRAQSLAATASYNIETNPQQSGLGANTQNPQLDVKGKINSINELLKNYNEELKNLTEMGLDADVVKTILETGDTRKYLLAEAKELTKELLKYYGNLSILEKGFFKDSEVCNRI